MPLSQEHRSTVLRVAEEIWKLTGTPRQAIYYEMHQVFRVAKYEAILDAQWPALSRWLRRKLDEARAAKE